MTLAQLLAKIKSLVDDSGYTDDDITSRINMLILKVAGGVSLPGKFELSPPLPDLYTEADIVTVADQAMVNLPATFLRSVESVVNADGDSIELYKSFKDFQKKNPKKEAGAVSRCCAYGSRLLYRDIPATPETLTVGFYCLPTVLVTESSVPTCIPSQLHDKIIINGTVKDIFDDIEDRTDGEKLNTSYYEAKFYEGIEELCEFIGEDGEPQYINDATEYIE